MTDRIEAGARALIAEVDALGGAAAAIERGFFQETIARSAWSLQQAQERGEVTVVGVNRYTDAAPQTPIEAPNFPELEVRQQDRLARVKAARDTRSVDVALAAVTDAASGTSPLVPPIVTAVRARATLGEISDALRRVWGVYRPAA